MKFAIACICFLFALSCVKVPLPFEDNSLSNDPNISLYENYQVSLSTYKTDSFVTSGHGIFTVGHHKDPVFGTINGSAFAGVLLPASNTVKNQDVSFDSLVLILRPTAVYYGDTLMPVKFSVHRVLEPIENEDNADANFFNPRQFTFENAALGETITNVRPLRGNKIVTRLSDVLGQDLLRKFRNDNDTIRKQGEFERYLNGIHIKADSGVSQTLYYFRLDSGNILRLHYTLNGAIPQEKYLDFPVNTQRQCNSLRHHHNGTDLSAFAPYKEQLKPSKVTGNKAFLNSNMGSIVKISFPTLLGLKETYPYVRVLKAELVIKPPMPFHKYPYRLPEQLYLYTTDDGNMLKALITDESGQSPQTGRLVIDDLYGEKTQYSFDITAFINELINEGRFSKLALMLVSPAGFSDTRPERLLLNDAETKKSVQLKLYVLGL
jgi:hypothetical protein